MSPHFTAMLLIFHTAAIAAFETHLFMDLKDVYSSYGLIYGSANTVVPTTKLKPPQGIDFNSGSLVIAVLPSITDLGQFEVYAENTTGWEPLVYAPRGEHTKTRSGTHECKLVRYTTTDFVRYSPGTVTLTLPQCSGTPTMKSIARDDESGLYSMFTVGGGDGASGTYTSHDGGLHWIRGNTTGIRKPDKDDLNLIYNKGRFVDMQIVWQNHTLKYCDNGGCDKRRVISAKTSLDGIDWGPDLPYITPDAEDPPELQFYRMRPFYIGNTSRLVAHTLLYAPAPSQKILGSRYGRQPSMCIPESHGNNCHGPHLYEEWFVGPQSGDAADTSGWRRPYRRTQAAPRDAFLMANPVPYQDELVWVGSTGSVYTVPMYRIAGLYAPANGEFSTQPFLMPHEPMWVNIDARWHGRLNNSYHGGGCDEGCAAYFYATVLDADTGKEIPGYGVDQAQPAMDVDLLQMQLQWRREGDMITTSVLSGRHVRLRIHFRDATVFAVGAG